MAADDSFSGFWDGMYQNGSYLELWEEHEPDPLVGRLLASLALPAGTRVLDLGCGTGLEACAMAGLGWIASGIDISETAVSMARERSAALGLELDWRVGSVLELPWDDDSFELLTDRGCLHLIPHSKWRRYAAEAHRVLRPASRLLLRACSDCGNPDFSCLSREMLEEHLLPAGFRLLESTPLQLANRRGGLPGLLCLLESAHA
ncbi:class I SAM-dependent methyltransferase [bacterium]|nr:class I SAM-dependent methyltransferase [bacterium]